MSNLGWIKLHRKIKESPLYKDCNSKQRDILINLLLSVNHKPNKWVYGGKEYEVKSGQLITSLESIANMCSKDVSIQNVRTALKKFERYGFLTNKSTNKNRLITIENWELYQSNEENQQTNQHAINKQLTTNKNVNNEKSKIYSEIIEKFNITCTELSKVKKLTEARKKVINARIKEYDKETVLEIIHIVSKTSFLNGSNEKGWKANFDWIMSPNNFIKILEGNYQDKSINVKVDAEVYSPDDSQLKW
ncbi:hypothetical protein KLK96_06580 [Clostridioides difficile]|uniref:hypothetical protein n=1 Tax=Clostridioides difficile TaxID=1496 RepID=UPI00038DA49C|nr:hypothetical protein [Clostridioides difficile]EGT3755409.1 hypothetical protein [Clostridioides difficile]EGT4158054.1 hypothetical protein [Clostridioides difficile]EGT4632199.1 hypothetical protein [Clostridioides difficile]EGT5346692.1 hypothetical protein [Clostridioides difficile]EGT5349145.1 hypothetical protein [Clostridioides difficile]